MELEREKNDVLIIAHETVLRCLYAYLFDRPATVSYHYLYQTIKFSASY
jgi:broad specificity phosphatase PhoE